MTKSPRRTTSAGFSALVRSTMRRSLSSPTCGEPMWKSVRTASLRSACHPGSSKRAWRVTSEAGSIQRAQTMTAASPKATPPAIIPSLFLAVSKNLRILKKTPMPVDESNAADAGHWRNHMPSRRLVFLLFLSATAGVVAFFLVPKPLPELSRQELIAEVQSGYVHEVVIVDGQVVIAVSTRRGPFRVVLGRGDNSLRCYCILRASIRGSHRGVTRWENRRRRTQSLEREPRKGVQQNGNRRDDEEDSTDAKKRERPEGHLDGGLDAPARDPPGHQARNCPGGNDEKYRRPQDCEHSPHFLAAAWRRGSTPRSGRAPLFSMSFSNRLISRSASSGSISR